MKWLRHLLRWRVRLPDDERTCQVPRVPPDAKAVESLERRRAELRYVPEQGFLKDRRIR